MDVNLKLVKVAVSLLLVLWLPWDFWKKRRDICVLNNHSMRGEKPPLVIRIIVLLNFMSCISYLGFCLSEFWRIETGLIENVLSSVAWLLACVLAIYTMNNVHKKVPLVLTLGWAFLSICDLLLVSAYLLHCFELNQVSQYLPKPEIIDFASLPLSLVLCFYVMVNNRTPKMSSSTEPLLTNQLQRDPELKCNSDPFSSAGIWSHMIFGWLNPLFVKGHREKLQLDDLPPIPSSETADEASKQLEECLRKVKSQNVTLPRAILNAIWIPLATNAVFAGINTIASYIGPLLITSFVNFLSADENVNWHQGLFLALIFFSAKTVESLTQRQWYYGARRIGIRVRAALMALIYKKALTVRYGDTSSGKIINFINVDVERIGDFFWYLHGIWLLPVQVIFALVILCKNLGAAPSAAAFLTTVLVMVSNTPLANMQKRLHGKIMEAKDSRIKATSETLKSMRVLKLHAWESTFLVKLLQLRETERGWLKKYLYTSSAVAFLFWASPTLVSVVTFGVCIMLGTPLTSGTVLSALATFRILQEPIYNLPELISMTAQTRVSIDRVQSFFMKEDHKVLQQSRTLVSPDISVEIEAGEYAWQNRDGDKPAIKITERLTIPKGSKVAICGSVGSGKTSFICSILGEIPIISGLCIKSYGSKAFVPQTSWIQTGTVRDNVLFGEEMDRASYEHVLAACSLNQDIEIWGDGDLCMIGERGLNLSGGQKQRIQMARALFSNSDIYLLDDPFSAVDAHTGAHMFKECLMQILNKKTVVYVTHQLEFLGASDLVLVMKDGKIAESGKYQDLIANPDGELTKLMASHRSSLSQMNNQKKMSLAKSSQANQVEVSRIKFVDLSRSSKVSEQSMSDDTETGRVKWHVYATFVTSAYRGALVPVILLCQILFQALQMASNYWITWGSEQVGSVTKPQLIEIFGFLSGGSCLFMLGRTALLSTIAIETAQQLFLGLITSVFRAPLSFFDSTPSSILLNRSSTDQSTVDTDIPYRLAGLAFALIQLLSVVALMSHVAWQVFILFLVVFALSLWYQSYYIATARELARMVPIQQAPILHHFSESISGAAVIRCFNQEARFWKKNMELIDNYSRASFHNSGTMEWLCVRINFLFNLVFFLLLVILVSLPRSTIDPSLAGLAATYGLNLNVLQAWVIWNLCNVENKMISVERILHFKDIPCEAALVIEDCRPKKGWPHNGTIEIKNLYIQYSFALPKVLKGITCTFPGEKKIGIVGRTGSGKSTLIQALFRVVEPSHGCIVIDGLDISKIGLQDLRSRLSIIPQDPILFQGTLRMNIDPLEEHSDQTIWEVLRKCHLSETMKGDEQLLDAPVAEDGENWSVGQRQLVCLARVLLQRRKILVLDEATASVDTATDNLIQKTIREETGGCTVLTVAHRIPTVVDNDLVLVLGDDHPQRRIVSEDTCTHYSRRNGRTVRGK
ncbi:putative ABC transporter C family member 15 isoform X2 [Andrographis paniculata]|uniref:putative ABC transporter C family member 15 isoform X2 n=1 Tax=Andrographis paniculata TaxID=175694 RepID=UPI0021E808AD|nr:putative ABC transporter C family member 15 isoform X2 [Andrographis paniculata]